MKNLLLCARSNENNIHLSLSGFPLMSGYYKGFVCAQNQSSCTYYVKEGFP